MYVHADPVHVGPKQEPGESAEARNQLRNGSEGFCRSKRDMRLDLRDGGEQRWQTIGCVDVVVVLVVHTLISDDTGELLRIISARKATPRERRLYEEGQHGY